MFFFTFWSSRGHYSEGNFNSEMESESFTPKSIYWRNLSFIFHNEKKEMPYGGRPPLLSLSFWCFKKLDAILCLSLKFPLSFSRLLELKNSFVYNPLAATNGESSDVCSIQSTPPVNRSSNPDARDVIIDWILNFKKEFFKENLDHPTRVLRHSPLWLLRTS